MAGRFWLCRFPAPAKPFPLSTPFLTATSAAACVNGLSVVDIGTRFSRFGQAIVLLLIQVGGIGIMTLSTTLLMMVGQRFSLTRHEGVSQLYASMAQNNLEVAGLRRGGRMIGFVRRASDAGEEHCVSCRSFSRYQVVETDAPLSQDIVDRNWPQIVRMARRVEETNRHR